MTTVTQTPRYR